MYPTCSMVSRTTADISIQAEVVISPATSTKPVVVAVSHATRAMGSCAKIASSTPSEIWSQSLSGCPSVTDSLVKKAFGLFMKLLKVGWSPSLKTEKAKTEKACLGAGLPGVEVLVLLSGEGVDTDAHGVQLEAGDLFVDCGGQGVDAGLHGFG